MSQPCSKRKAVTACTMPGRSGQLRVRVNVLVTVAPGDSAFDDVERETTAGGLLVLVLHVRPGFAHRLDRLVEGDLVPTVAADGEPGSGDCLDRAHRVAFDARDLHE